MKPTVSCFNQFIIDMWVNSKLKKLQNHGYTGFLSRIIHIAYKLKRKDIKGVTFLRDLGVWEFKIGNDYFYSSGPGWAYDYEYLLCEFSNHLGFEYMPKAGDCIIDVGAGVGEELMIFSKLVGNEGRVYAIEAHPKTFRTLKYNLEKNKFSNTELLNVAVSDVPGHIYIEDNSDSLANRVSKEKNANSFKVESITIEQLVDQFKISQIDFMKVNIEGAEQLLIKGIGNAIDKIRNIAISCHDFRYMNEGIEFFQTKKLIIEYLQDANFACTTRDTGNPLLDDYVYASPKSQ